MSDESNTPELPTHVSELDWLRLREARAQVDAAEARLGAARQSLSLVEAMVADTYKLGDGDGIDPRTLEIKRKPKLEAVG